MQAGRDRFGPEPATNGRPLGEMSPVGPETSDKRHATSQRPHPKRLGHDINPVTIVGIIAGKLGYND